MLKLYAVEWCRTKANLPGYDPNGAWRLHALWTTEALALGSITPEMKQSESVCYRVRPVEVQG